MPSHTSLPHCTIGRPAGPSRAPEAAALYLRPVAPRHLAQPPRPLQLGLGQLLDVPLEFLGPHGAQPLRQLQEVVGGGQTAGQGESTGSCMHTI